MDFLQIEERYLTLFKEARWFEKEFVEFLLAKVLDSLELELLEHSLKV